jgi:hypothetical protein
MKQIFKERDISGIGAFHEIKRLFSQIQKKPFSKVTLDTKISGVNQRKAPCRSSPNHM